ncbi:MAG: hypothetical protein EXR86_07295 [Gammaproteobacteria bacterium]|nr:hypothetical protein [Gammaproteobacteria bacterium]
MFFSILGSRDRVGLVNMLDRDLLNAEILLCGSGVFATGLGHCVVMIRIRDVLKHIFVLRTFGDRVDLCRHCGFVIGCHRTHEKYERERHEGFVPKHEFSPQGRMSALKTI